jgi:hypothetical protein
MISKNKIAHMMMIALFPFVLGGCLPLAAVPVLVAAQYGAAGFMAYKTVRSSVGGSVSVGFGEEKPAPGSEVAMAAIKRPAVWPGNEIEVALANKMQSEGVFEELVTPSRTAKAIKELGVDSKITRLTRDESLDAFGKICAGTRADAVIAFQGLGVKSAMNMWSFSNATATHRTRIVIYSRQTGAVVYESVMEVKDEIGGTNTGYAELLRIAGETAAEKIMQLSGRDGSNGG